MFNFFYYLCLTLFITVCVFLILLVLVQKGRGGGLSGAFGGSGGNTAFGSKTGDVLTWATSVVFGIFLLLAIVMNLMANHEATVKAKPPSTVTPVPASPAGGLMPPMEPYPAPTSQPTTP
jgi:preprotein translocase subunit SecG